VRKLNGGIKVCVVLLLCATTVTGTLTQTGASGPAAAPIFTTVHSFDFTDGAYPYAGLVQGTDGYLYGTTFGGGCGQGDEGEGCGTVFKMTPSGNLTSLYIFCSQGGDECTDGLFPRASLVQGTDGKFYGTTSNGGGGYDDDNGTVFSITASGKLTTLYTFCLQGGEYCPDGSAPFAGLVQGSDGSFYGTTIVGGANGDYEGGTVFTITPSGELTTIYSFCSQGSYKCTDGESPDGTLVLGTDGKFYGTTIGGGTYGYGTVFSITTSGTLATLYSFCAQKDCPDGAEPEAGLVQGRDGNFYGTTFQGDTVFKITPSGNLTVLYHFCSKSGYPCPDGQEPAAKLVQGTDGNFYGTTEIGGTKGFNGDDCSDGCGTIFQITPKGELTTLYDFCSQTDCADGSEPQSGLIQDTNGTFYGMVPGGAGGYGLVYSLSVGLGPFIETAPTSGKVGAVIKILGTSLTSVTNVRFNGIEAKFTIVSASEITTTVPTGATTGPVRVITPTGKLQATCPSGWNESVDSAWRY
jgi:uncharacterized repeat protein (TIGR03803 family)